MSDTEERALFLIVCIIGISIIAVYIRERLPVSRLQLGAMTLCDHFLCIHHMLLWLFLLICSTLLLTAGQEQPEKSCGLLVYVCLAKFCLVTGALVSILIEKVRSVNTKSTARWRDVEHLAHCLVIGLGFFGLVCWLFAGSRASIMNGQCMIHMPLGATWTGLIYLFFTATYLTTRFCLPLYRTRDPILRNLAIRSALGTMLTCLLSMGNAALAIAMNGHQRLFWCMIYCLAEMTLSATFLQYLLLWSPNYKKLHQVDRVRSRSLSGESECSHPGSRCPKCRARSLLMHAPSYHSRVQEPQMKPSTHEFYLNTRTPNKDLKFGPIATAEELEEHFKRTSDTKSFLQHGVPDRRPPLQSFDSLEEEPSVVQVENRKEPYEVSTHGRTGSNIGPLETNFNPLFTPPVYDHPQSLSMTQSIPVDLEAARAMLFSCDDDDDDNFEEGKDTDEVGYATSAIDSTTDASTRVLEKGEAEIIDSPILPMSFLRDDSGVLGEDGRHDSR